MYGRKMCERVATAGEELELQLSLRQMHETKGEINVGTVADATFGEAAPRTILLRATSTDDVEKLGAVFGVKKSKASQAKTTW